MATGHNNSNRCDFQEDYKYILLPVSYSLVFVIGLALNATALYWMLFRTKTWTPFTIYMFNLTVCDTLYILTLPFLIYYFVVKNDWPFTEPLCKIIRFLFYTNLYGSIMFLCCISVHRFMGICHTLAFFSDSTRRAKLVSAAVWAWVLLSQAPILYFARTSNRANKSICYDTTSPELYNNFVWYSAAVLVLMFALPFMVVMVCYGRMVRTLLQPNWLSEEVKRECLEAQQKKQKAVKMIVLVLAMFMLCFLPFHLTRGVYYSLRYWRNVNPSQITCKLLEASTVAYILTRPLASANSCVDPIVYFLAGQDVRSNLTRKIRSFSRRGSV